MRKESTLLKWALVAMFAVFVGCCVAFVLMHGHVVLNRFTDSWWHIAAADEYLRTGNFAGDPFVQNAPPFAQFGLVEYANASISRLTGADTKQVFVFLVAFNVMVVLVSSFLAGYRLNGSVIEGCVCAVTWPFVYSRHGIIGFGLSFFAALSLLFLLMVLCWSGESFLKGGKRSALWMGLILGVTFDLHAFVGLVGCVVAGVAFGLELSRVKTGRRSTDVESSYQLVLKAALFGLAFLAVSWRWILLHISLRPALNAINEHVRPEYAVQIGYVFVLLGGLVMLALIILVRVEGGRGGGLLSCFVLGCALLVMCLPFVNRLIGEYTSWYMARRIPKLFPLGVVLAYAYSHLADTLRNRRLAPANLCIALLGAALVMPSFRNQALLHLHLCRTHDFDRHSHECLTESMERTFSGKTILSDPVTSYYARGMIGSYAVTVPAGHASPAVDYKAMDRKARNALAGGPDKLKGMRVDAVIVNKQNDATAKFSRKAYNEILRAWIGGGWRATIDTADLTVLVPGS